MFFETTSAFNLSKKTSPAPRCFGSGAVNGLPTSFGGVEALGVGVKPLPDDTDGDVSGVSVLFCLGALGFGGAGAGSGSDCF